MDCLGTYFTHVQTCDNFRCQSASRWTASVHTSHMSKPVITLVFKVPSNGLLNSIKLAQTQSFLRDPYFWTRAHILDITLFYVRVEIAKLQRRLCVMSILVQKSQIPHAPKKRMPKLLKTQMLAMCTFYCKLHMKLMTTENVMLHLHGKNQCEVRFFKKPMRF